MNTRPSSAAAYPPFWRSVVGSACLATVFLAALLLEACTDNTPTDPDDADAPVLAAVKGDDSTQIVIEPHWLTLDTIGVSDTLTATVTNAQGDTIEDATVTWKSADTAIATVDSAGVVTSADFGRTRVTATYDSATAWATVEVALPLTDREILEKLYEATGGDDWTDNTNWLSDEDLSEWHGIDTDGDGRVIRLDLYKNELAGAIPAEIGGLGRLKLLRLSHNAISGTIPAELGKFTRLERLELNNNELEGGLPPEMGGMKDLEYLDVAHNRKVSGIVPHTFAGLQLETFYSTRTELCVPPSLKDWFDEIPRTDNPTPCTARISLNPPSLYSESLGDTATLSATAVDAEGDTLHGAAVTWASADTAIATVDTTGLVTTIGYGATDVTATSDSLTGTARVEIVFKLSDRQVLDSLFRATGGENWTDTTNWLSDKPLSEWYGVETSDSGEVVGLALGDNNLTGSIPDVLAELDSLVTLDLGGNALAGRIPWDLRELRQLRNLVLNGNELEGLLPRSLGYMAGLRYLHIGDNRLSGLVPREFSRLELDTLYAADSGVCVPPSLGEWFEEIEQTDSATRCVASITIEVVDLPSLRFYAAGETGDLTATHVSAEGDTTYGAAATWSSGDTAVVSVSAAGRVTAVGDGETEITATYDSTTGTIAAEVALPENDRDVLAILYDRTRGDGWTDAANWLSDEPLSEWAGVETDDSGRVVGLSLRDNNLRGTIHSSIGLLDRLVTLDLSRNWVTGPIPAEVGDLTLLGELALSVNGFVGKLPSGLGALDSLQSVNVAATSLSGLVPASFADLELESFLVAGTGVCVPPSLSGWLDSIAETDDPPECAGRVVVDPASLTFDARGDTATLTATVIDAEGDVVEDAEVTWKSGDTRVARVNTTGRVTARASGVTNVTATYDSVTSSSAEAAVRLPGGDRVALEAFYRAMGGDDWTDNTNWLSDEPLGEWYGVDTLANGRVRYLELKDNNLVGEIPAEIGLLDSLFSFSLRDTTVTGPIPAAIGRLERLRDLTLRYTHVDGSLPPEMGNMAGLEHLSLDYTKLSGPLPATFANLTLKWFYHYATGLCVPRSLIEWYESTGNTDPLPCIPETADRAVLDSLYRKTGGENWNRKDNWLTGKRLNTWKGIVTDEEGYVTEIFLPWNNLTDSIPPELGNLARLEVLVLHGNNLTGRIPPELGNLSNLVHLGLYENRLEGAIPPELGNMTRLIDFYLSENQLTGTIPAELANLPVVEDFGVQNNKLTGSIPPEFGRLSSLVLLSFANNNLSGPLPPELGDLSNLKVFDARENRFTGPIPAEFGKLSKLEQLRLSENGLSGRIPPELGSLRNLEDWWFSFNQLEGPLPAELGNLESLVTLSGHTNRLSGPLPPELGKLSNLELLWLSWNKITGPIPPELGSLQNLEFLSLWINQVDGPIPPELGNMTSLEVLILSQNRLSGSIPPELGNLPNLLHLGLYENQLTGAIPPELGSLPKLVDFWLSENQFTGTIPAELGNLSTVEDFGVQNNKLTGSIPAEFSRMSSLVQLALYNNDLSGTLPPELGQLNNLSDLRVHDNSDLEGLLPRSFMNLPLTYLDIDGTDVCPQLDDIFQAWLRKIRQAYGLVCHTTLVERFALSEFYAATGGDSWTNNSGWDSDSSVEDWYGVTVGDSLVRQLRLPDNSLEGPLPPVIANLRELKAFDLADNELHGGFPDPVATMDALDTIRVSGNRDMEGPFPYRMIGLEDLRALQYKDTDLCASPSKTFQEWIDSLDIAEGATCENPDSVKLTLPVVYLTQAIQRPEGDIALMPDREALLRVFLVSDQENAFFEPEVFATFTRDGEEIHRVVMPSEQDRLATLVDESDLVKSYNAVIPAEHIDEGTMLVVVADSAKIVPRAAGSQTRFPESGSHALDVIDVPPMELTVVPVLEAEDPDSSVFEWTDGIDDDSPQVSQFRHSFPFSEFSAGTREAHVTSLDLTSDNGQWNLLLELEKIRKDEEATGYWYGAALSKNGYVRGVARRNGWVSIGKPEGPELAHEVGHTLNLAHAPCGGAGGPDPDFPHPNGSIGAWGYDVRDSTILSPKQTPDVMGYCYRGEGTSWLSDYYYEKVIGDREDKEGDGEQERRAGAGPKGRMLVLWGGVLNGELRIEPLHPMYTTATLPEESGPYRLDGITRTGEADFSLSFTPGEDVYGNKYFLFTIPIEEDWEDSLERITLTGPGGEVTVDSSDRRAITVVTDSSTGRIRAILRDWDRALPAVLGDTSGLEVETTRGIAEAVRLR